MLQLNRKLFANSFLSGMVPLRVIPTGDFSTPLRCARNDSRAWRRCESYRWETVCGRFPVRRGVTAFHLSKKLLANSFPSGIAPMCFMAILPIQIKHLTMLQTQFNFIYNDSFLLDSYEKLYDNKRNTFVKKIWIHS